MITWSRLNIEITRFFLKSFLRDLLRKYNDLFAKLEEFELIMYNEVSMIHSYHTQGTHVLEGRLPYKEYDTYFDAEIKLQLWNDMKCKTSLKLLDPHWSVWYKHKKRENWLATTQG